MKYNIKEIREQLTIEQIENLIAELGGEPQRHNDVLICKTICHNGDSHKLYYYNNSKHFQCWTNCGTIGDVFEFVLKVKQASGEKKTYYSTDGKLTIRDWTLPDAVEFVAVFFHLSATASNFFDGVHKKLEDDEKVQERYQKIKDGGIKQNIELTIFDDKILQYLPRPRIKVWEDEGITSDIIKEFNISYNPQSQGIVIPHYDMNDNLIGIRERTLLLENEKYGKYRPSILNGKMYNHPLSFALYGLNKSKKAIQILKTAIIFEGEKSVLKYASFVGIENNIAVACCGSSIVEYQINLLRQLGVNNIIIALDKQYKQYGDEEYRQWEKKYKEISKKCRGLNVSFLIDDKDILGYKDSPIDCKWDDFYTLYENRKVLK